MNTNRYSRQIMLPEWGMEGQQKLSRARVLVIGAGGLGCPALLYLAAAGVGVLGIVDGDKVEVSNLHRQVLYGDADLGNWKAIAAEEKFQTQYPSILVEPIIDYLHAGNAWEIIEDYDLVIDGSDNFSTRYLVNDTCVLLGKPLIYGSVYRFEGQVAVFNFKDPQKGLTANYRHFFPEPPEPLTVPTCNTAGVIGLLPGIIGSMQALEAIKILLGMGELLTNTIYCFNALNHQSFRMNSSNHSPIPNIPKNRAALESGNYDFGCHPHSVIEMDCADLEEIIQHSNITLIDVRETFETPANPFAGAISMPLSTLQKSIELPLIKTDIVLFCQSGQRSKTAIHLLKNRVPKGIQLFSLKGGLKAYLEWKQAKESMHI